MDYIPSRRGDNSLVFKIVFYGLESSGAVEFLEWLSKKEAKTAHKFNKSSVGATLILENVVERVSNVIFQCQTAGGHRDQKSQRQILLKGADGVIFVWDSDPEMWEENIWRFKELMQSYGQQLLPDEDGQSEVPLVLCANKRDLPYVTTIEKIEEVLTKAGLGNSLIYETISETGVNVKRAFVYTAREAVLKHYLKLKKIDDDDYELNLENLDDFPQFHEIEKEAFKEIQPHLKINGDHPKIIRKGRKKRIGKYNWIHAYFSRYLVGIFCAILVAYFGYLVLDFRIIDREIYYAINPSEFMIEGPVLVYIGLVLLFLIAILILFFTFILTKEIKINQKRITMLGLLFCAILIFVIVAYNNEEVTEVWTLPNRIFYYIMGCISILIIIEASRYRYGEYILSFPTSEELEIKLQKERKAEKTRLERQKREKEERRRKEQEKKQRERQKEERRIREREEQEKRKNQIRIFMQKAEEFFKHGDYTKAAENYDYVLQLDKNNQKACIEKGRVLIKSEKYQEAIQCYDKLLKYNNNNTNFLRQKAICLSKIGNFEKALECYNIVLKHEPNNADIWREKADVAFKMNKFRYAIDCYNKTLKLNPADAISWINKGMTHFKLNKFQKAIECYNAALKLDPKLEIARNNLKETTEVLIDAKSTVLEKLDEIGEIYSEIPLSDIKTRLLTYLTPITSKQISLKDILEDFIKQKQLDAKIKGDQLQYLTIRDTSIIDKSEHKHISSQKDKFDVDKILIRRGIGDWEIEENQSVITYKIKIRNTSPYVITDIKCIVTPPAGVKTSKNFIPISRLPPGTEQAPSIELGAIDHCVGDYIQGMVLFLDPFGKQQTIEVKPIRITYTCNLLVPKQISQEYFDEKTQEMKSKQILRESRLDPLDLAPHLDKIIRNANFHIMDSNPPNIIHAFAQGKYDQQDVALKVICEQIEQGTKCFIKAMSDKAEKTIDLLKEISTKLEPISYNPEFWTCSECGEKIEDTGEICEHCGSSKTEIDKE